VLGEILADPKAMRGLMAKAQVVGQMIEQAKARGEARAKVIR
jgi:hypothetical protein